MSEAPPIWLGRISGKPFDLQLDASVDPDQVVPWEIAWSLAQINRFTGHTRHPEPVARHSRRVAAVLAAWGHDEATQLKGLLHDAPETFMGDISSPMIALIDQLSGGKFKQWKSQFDRNVLKALGVEMTPEEEALVKAADLTACMIEHRYHHLYSERVWDLGIPDELIPFGYDEDDIEASYHYKKQHVDEAITFARVWCHLSGMRFSKDFSTHFIRVRQQPVRKCALLEQGCPFKVTDPEQCFAACHQYQAEISDR